MISLFFMNEFSTNKKKKYNNFIGMMDFYEVKIVCNP